MTDDAPANRLIHEKSPYLLAHARQPVDWYPWGDEAFERARVLDRPVFLSIGYAACHWCHVMAHESFEDPEIARLLNEAFVCVKVDREERPDVDQVYMTVCQLLTGSGGWPLTVIMTPDRRPFFAGTYFPKESRFGATGMRELVPRIAAMWRERRESLVEAADQVTASLAQAAGAPAEGEVDPRAIERAYEALVFQFDSRPRRVRQRAEVPDAAPPALPAPALAPHRPPAGARDGRADARRDPARRGLRPARVRGPPVLDRRPLARAALREDALRPGALRPRLRRGLPGHAGSRPTGTRPRRRSPTCSASSSRPRVRSSRPRTPIPRARRESSTSGRRTRSTARSRPKRPRSSTGSSASRPAATSSTRSTPSSADRTSSTGR